MNLKTAVRRLHSAADDGMRTSLQRRLHSSTNFSDGFGDGLNTLRHVDWTSSGVYGLHDSTQLVLDTPSHGQPVQLT